MKNIKSRWFGLGCVTAIILVGVVAGSVVFFGLVPDIEDQLPPDRLVVTLSTPLNGENVPLNAVTVITASAISSDPIDKLELWVDGVLSDLKEAPIDAPLKELSSLWTWLPGTEGEHTLQVRASGDGGQSALSNMVRVSAKQELTLSTDYFPQEEETLETIAAKFGVSPGQIENLNPGLDPGDPPSGEPIQVPLPSPQEESEAANLPSPPGGPTTPIPEFSSNPLIFWLAKNIPFMGPQLPPQAPSLSAELVGCDVTLYIMDQSDNETGYFVFRSDPKSGDFVSVAQKGAGMGTLTYTDTNLYGEIGYYVTAFNAVGKASSNPVSVDVDDPSCLTSEWTGFGLVEGAIVVDQPVDLLYCYLATENLPWTRIPPAQDSFLTGEGGAFDISPYMKALSGSPAPDNLTLNLECWGWVAGTLTPLGKGSQEIGAASNPSLQVDAENYHLLGATGVILLDSGLPDIDLAPPYSLRLTEDLATCMQHAGFLAGLFCEAALTQGDAVLVWEWVPFCSPGSSECTTKISGYKVYEFMSDGSQVLRKTIYYDKRKAHVEPRYKVKEFAWGGPFPTDCFVVRAIAKETGEESADSNMVCIQWSEIGPTIKILSPSDMLWRFRRTYEDCDLNYGTAPHYKAYPPSAGTLIAGYEHSTDHCDWWNVAYRGAVWFDLSQISGTLLEARLQFNWQDSIIESGPASAANEVLSCLTNVMLATEDWRGDPYGDQPITIPGKDYVYLYVGPPKQNYDLNVTSAVKEWLQGTTPNYGFVLRGNQENTKGNFGDNKCASVYNNFTLHVRVLE